MSLFLSLKDNTWAREVVQRVKLLVAEFNPQIPHGGEREPTPKLSYALHTLTVACASPSDDKIVKTI